MRYYLWGCLLLLTSGLTAQNSVFYFDGESQLQLREASVVNLLADLPMIDLSAAPPTSHELTLLTPTGETQTFFLWRTAVAEPALAARFPGIVTLGGMSKDDPRVRFRGEWVNEDGRQAPNANGTLSIMVFDPAERWVVRPLTDGSGYEMGTETDFAHLRQPFTCELDDHLAGEIPPAGSPTAAPYPIGEELRTYRMAVATTTDYSAFHGADTASVLAAILASVNRISEVYERDVAVTFQLVDETTKLIYIDSDPFSGSGPLSFLHEVIVDSIGLNNFDIGHLVDTGSGGIASLGAVCTSNRKGSGYTGLTPPEGDPFDIDYFAHEVGHQFNGNHTFNACSSSGPQPYEPGSGVTIMAYAGICGSNNVANRSIPQFHAVSILEITQFTQFGVGNNCPTVTATGNTPPNIAAVIPGNSVIPPSTPFEVQATGIDAETPEAITYSWEQYQTGPNVQLGDAAGTSPLFRNFNQRANPQRVFPRMQRILANQNDPTELLPDYDRALVLRVVGRDNSPGAGGVFWDDLEAVVRESGGPFRVTSQSESGTELAVGQVAIIEWDRGNTHQSPFSTSDLDLWLSADPVAGFDIYLGSVPNTGVAFVEIPEVPNADTYRFKLKGQDRLWFDLNNTDFSITDEGGPQVVINSLEDELILCGTGTLELDFFLSAINGASGDPDFELVGLPAEVQFAVTETDLLPGQSYRLTLTVGDDVMSGDYFPQLIGSIGDLGDTTIFRALLVTEPVAAPTDLTPISGLTDASVAGPFAWTDLQPGVRTYEVEFTTDTTNNFWETREAGLVQTLYVPALNFQEETTYFWRVRATDANCGTGPWSEIQSFTTERLVCLSYTATDTPKPMGPSLFVESRITIDEAYPIRSVAIRDIQGQYDDFGELRFLFLTQGAGGFDLVQTSSCQTNNFNFSVADTGVPLICSQVNSGATFRPDEPLGDVRNIDTEGVWRLRIFDQSLEGSLDNWTVEFCVPDRLVSTRNAPLAQAAVDIFPNPGNNVLNFRWSELPSAPQLIRLTDLTGRELVRLEGTQPRSAYQLQLNANGLPKGMYIYQMLTEDGRLLASGRWIKN